MAQAPNMKVNIGADTSDFEKGAKQVKQGLKDLEKTGDSALSALGSAFGVNTGKIGEMTSAIKGLGQKMTQCGDEGVKAFGNVLKSIGPVGGALAGLGLSAVVAGFKALNNEAQAFKQTVAGANMEMATAAYIDTYRQVLRDFRGDMGKSLAETESGFKKFFKTIGANIGAMFSTGANWLPLVPGGDAYGVQGMAEYLRQTKIATENANDAAYLTEKIGQLEFKRKQQSVEIAKINDQIAESLNKAKDTTNSLADRQAAIKNAEDLIAQKREMMLPLEQQIVQYYNELAGLATNTKQQEEIRLEASAREYEVSRQMTQEATSLLRVKNSIGTATEKEIAATNELIKKNKELAATIKATHDKWADIAGGVSTDGLGNVSGSVLGPAMTIVPQSQVDRWYNALSAQFGDLTIGVRFKVADPKEIYDITNQVTSLMESAVARTGELIGNLVGTLAGGGDAWGDFKSAALSAFGDMAIAVGKIAISMGVAASGINVALKDTGQWYVAVAAGAALVALGAAVKSSLSSVAAGDYSAGGGGYAGGSSGSGSSNYETRDVKVYVTGTLEADGDKLITVINNANKKNYYTQ